MKGFYSSVSSDEPVVNATPTTSLDAIQQFPSRLHKSYRADVDGLRAVAVLSVLIFHSFPGILRGGFIGVDVFFVISGFLISRTIFKELDSNNFSSVSFYNKRIRRIWPALMIVIFSTLVFGWAVLIGKEYTLLGKHVMGANFFVLNVIMKNEIGGYFDNSGVIKPLMHLWSLSVEEQFYFFCPLLYVLLWNRPWCLRIAASLVMFFSFMISVLGAAYLNSVSRMWELGLGCAVAYLHHLELNKRFQNDMIVVNLAGVVGFGLVLCSALYLSENSPYPSWRAIFPTIGSSIIVGVSEGSFVNRMFLSNPFMVWIGLISYPLYLWHWPLLNFARVLFETSKFSFGFVLSLQGIAVALAYLTYKFIEQPIRVGKYRESGKLSILCLLVGVSIILAGCGSLAMTNCIKPRPQLVNVQVDRVALANDDFESWIFSKNFKMTYLSATQPEIIPSLLKNGNFNPILIREGAISRTVLFIGDSNCFQYVPRLNLIKKSNPNNIVVWSYPGNPPIPGLVSRYNPPNYNFIDEALDYAFDPNVFRVVLASHWIGCAFAHNNVVAYFNQSGKLLPVYKESEGYELLFKSLEDLIVSLRTKGKEVAVILNIPILSEMDPEFMIVRNGFSLEVNLNEVKQSRRNEYVVKFNDRMRVMLEKHGCSVIDPADWMFVNGTLHPIQFDGRPIFQDAYHFSASFVRRNLTFLDSLVV